MVQKSANIKMLQTMVSGTPLSRALEVGRILMFIWSAIAQSGLPHLVWDHEYATPCVMLARILPMPLFFGQGLFVKASCGDPMCCPFRCVRSRILADVEESVTLEKSPRLVFVRKSTRDRMRCF